MILSAWRSMCGCLGLVAATAIVPAAAQNPLGYPLSLEEAAAVAADGADAPTPLPIPIEEQRPRAGVDPVRAPPFEVADPLERLEWYREPVGASPCDRNLVDAAWMGPGEYAYHLSGRCRCGRDHTRAFRSEFLGRVWLSGELLLWATSGQSLPALVTSSPAGTPLAQAGVIGSGSTSTLFGGGWATDPMRLGGRVTLGYWFDPTQHDGIEASFFELAAAQRYETFTNTGGGPLLARPYVNAVTGGEAAVVVPSPLTPPSDPALVAQSITAARSTTLLGVDVLMRHAIACDTLHRRWVVGGYRYLNLDEWASVSETATVSAATPSGQPSSTATVTDLFESTTQFHGGEFGIVERWWHRRVSLQVLGKVALGASVFDTTISGSTASSGSATTAGGVLAQPTNIGSGRTARFAAAGEAGISLDYALWSQCRASVGYTFLWWSTVSRVGEQIDRSVNPTQFPPGTLSGPARPAFMQRTNDFWAQGLNLGLEYQF